MPVLLMLCRGCLSTIDMKNLKERTVSKVEMIFLKKFVFILLQWTAVAWRVVNTNTGLNFLKILCMLATRPWAIQMSWLSVRQIHILTTLDKCRSPVHEIYRSSVHRSPKPRAWGMVRPRPNPKMLINEKVKFCGCCAAQWADSFAAWSLVCP